MEPTALVRRMALTSTSYRDGSDLHAIAATPSTECAFLGTVLVAMRRSEMTCWLSDTVWHGGRR